MMQVLRSHLMRKRGAIGSLGIFAICWGIQMFIGAGVVKVLAQSRPTVTETSAAVAAALATERVSTLADRVGRLEASESGETTRLATLEAVVSDIQNTNTERTRLEYGLIVGVGVQLIMSGMQWRKK